MGHAHTDNAPRAKATGAFVMSETVETASSGGRNLPDERRHKTMPGSPVSEETRARAIELMQAGELGRNAIAREVGVSAGTVSNIARDIGHEFDRSQSELAVAIQTVNLAKIRGDLAQAFALEAWRAIEDMHAPALMVQWASATEHQTGGWQEHVLPEPTISDRRNLMTVAGIAVTKIAELTKANDAGGSQEAAAYLDRLQDSLGLAAAALRERDASSADVDSDPTVEPRNVSREAMLAEFEAPPADGTVEP